MEKDPIYSEKPSETTIDAVEFLSNINTKKLGKKALTIVLSSAILVSSLFMGGCSEKSVSASDGESELDADYQTRYTVEDIYDGDIETPEDWFVDNSINYYDGTDSSAEGYNFNKLTPEQQSEIKKYDAMSVEEFYALPQEEQLKYSYWIFENKKPEMDMVYQFNEDDRLYNFNPKTAQDLLVNLIYLKGFFETIRTTKHNEETGSDENTYDEKNASKLISMAYFDNNSNEEKVRGSLDTIGDIFIPSTITATGYFVKEDGTIIVNCVEKVYDAEINGQYEFTRLEFTDIHEKKVVIYLVKGGRNQDDHEHYDPRAEQNTDATATIIN